VFFGSVNPKEFLHDPTGNRRYWTIEVAKLDHSHNIDMQQVWAQVHQEWLNGEGFYLTPDEMAMLNSHNEDFTAADPIEEVIQTGFDWASTQDYWTWKTATEALKLVNYERPSKADTNAAASAIRKLNGNQSRKTMHGKMLLTPPLK
jgi:putative DNA primase/helicase